MLSISKNANPNYLAKIVRVANLRKHSNADRLNVLTIDGNNVITSNLTQKGEIVIYFPLECQINGEFLSKNNQFRKKEFNADPEAVGFFEEHRRVKALKLRGEKSEGFIIPVNSLSYAVGSKYSELDQCIGQEFDSINGVLLMQKYIVPETKTPGQPGQGKGKQRKESKLLDNQFRLHDDTSQLGKNMHKLNLTDTIAVTWKLHGTSFVSSNILCKRKLPWYEKFAKWLGVNVNETEYSNVYSSRKVVKNTDLNPNANHYYGYDLWSDINDMFKDNLLQGESIYGEAVGYLKTGRAIQGNFDYNCTSGKFKVYIYRITMTTPQGKVVELPFNQIQERCAQLGVETVPLIHYGRALDFVSPIAKDSEGNRIQLSDDQWRDLFLKVLKEKYVYDQDSQFCRNVVPEEGIVVRKEGLKLEAFKLKAFRFLEGETKALDAGEVNIEDAQTTEE